MKRLFAFARARLALPRQIICFALSIFALALPAAAQEVTIFPVANFAIRGIAANPNGFLYFHAYDISKGEVFGRLGRISPAGHPEVFTAEYGRIESIAVGPDGRIWLVDATHKRVQPVSPEGIGGTPIGVGGNPPWAAGAGPDGAIWVTAGTGGSGGAQMWRINNGSASLVTAFGNASTNSFGEVIAGPDGAVWTTDPLSGKYYRFTTQGAVAAGTTTISNLSYTLAAGADGSVWVSQNNSSNLWRLTASSASNFPVTSLASNVALATGSDGALWFESDVGVGRVTLDGTTTKFPLPGVYEFGSGAGILRNAMTAGPDGAIWFIANDGAKDAIGRIAPPPAPPTIQAAVLPSSRSVKTGSPATAFATMINTGQSALSGCKIAPVTNVPAAFSFQTTNPSTNALTGTANTPATIPGGGTGFQTFVIAFTPAAAFQSTDVQLGFSCNTAAAAQTIFGVNSLLLTAETIGVPDMVALSATPKNDGIMHIPGASAASAFAVASVNVGTSGSITVKATTGTVTLPLTLTVCQTNPSTGQCLSPPAASVTTTINANATPTFGIFGTASGTIPLLPGANRVFVRFTDGSGILRGSTSVAVTTQ